MADHYFREMGVDWKELRRSAFNDRSNPDDHELGIQIVKDLHRTGCSTFSGSDNDQERAVLKRVLLGYARWNKEIGYCQGFNIIAALILDVVGRKEEEALKIMIFLVDKVLPTSYFSNNLRALSVDMAVFRDLMNHHLPRLSKHLRDLQIQAQQDLTSGGYEPPLTNVFTMQWFLTLFATCLPLHAVLRIWDAIMMEGSEVIIRTALALWEVLQGKLLKLTHSADDFYTEMGSLLQDIVDQRSDMIDVDDLLGMVYSFAPFPFPKLNQLREQYTYNITPISSQEPEKTPSRKSSREQTAAESAGVDSMTDIARALDPGKSGRGSLDIEGVGPGVFGSDSGITPGECPPGVSSEGSMAMAERTSIDISKLEKKYDVIRRRQSQAKIMMHKAKLDETFGKQPARRRVTNLVIPPAPTLKNPGGFMSPSLNAVNHLYVRPDNETCRRNRHVVPYGSTLFTDETKKGSGSAMRYAGAYFVSTASREDGQELSKGEESDATVTKVTFSESDDEASPNSASAPTNDENNNDHNNHNDDISKTLLQLHLEWKDRRSNGEESSDSSLSAHSLNVPRNPFSAPSQPVGLGAFSTDDIKRSETRNEKKASHTSPKAVAPKPVTENKGESQPVVQSVKPKALFFPHHVRREKREFGIKLGIYKPSDFNEAKPPAIRAGLTSSDRNTPRITRQQINNCLSRESFASASWDRKS